MLRNYKNFSYIILLSFCFAPEVKVDSFWEQVRQVSWEQVRQARNLFSCNVNLARNNEEEEEEKRLRETEAKERRERNIKGLILILANNQLVEIRERNLIYQKEIEELSQILEQKIDKIFSLNEFPLYVLDIMIGLDVDKTLLQIKEIKKVFSKYYNLYCNAYEGLKLQDQNPRKMEIKMEMLKRTLAIVELLDDNSTKIHKKASQENATPPEEDTKEIRVVKMQIILKILLTMSEQCFGKIYDKIEGKSGVDVDSNATLWPDRETREIYVKNNSQKNTAEAAARTAAKQAQFQKLILQLKAGEALKAAEAELAEIEKAAKAAAEQEAAQARTAVEEARKKVKEAEAAYKEAEAAYKEAEAAAAKAAYEEAARIPAKALEAGNFTFGSYTLNPSSTD